MNCSPKTFNIIQSVKTGVNLLKQWSQPDRHKDRQTHIEKWPGSHLEVWHSLRGSTGEGQSQNCWSTWHLLTWWWLMTGWSPPSPGNLFSSQTPTCGNTNSLDKNPLVCELLSVQLRLARPSPPALSPTVSEAPHHERSQVCMQVHPGLTACATPPVDILDYFSHIHSHARRPISQISFEWRVRKNPKQGKRRNLGEMQRRNPVLCVKSGHAMCVIHTVCV